MPPAILTVHGPSASPVAKELRIQAPTRSASKPLIVAAYPVALLLVLSAVVEQGPRFSPLHTADLNWRFSALSLAFHSILTPLLGLVIAMAAALLVRRRITLRVLATLSLLVGIAAAAGVFVLLRDFNALSAATDVATRSQFRFSGWSVIGLGALVSVVLLWLGIGGWVAAARLWIEPDPGRRGGLVVGQ